METDVRTDTKTRKRMKDVAAERVTSGDNSSAQVNPDPMCLTSFGGDSTESPALPCSRDDAVVDNGAAAPKSCLSPVEMRTLTAARDLVLAGKVCTATRIIFYQPPLWFCQTEEINSRTTIQYAMDDSSFWKMKVSEEKLSQTLAFDPGGSTGRLPPCPFLGTWRALLCGDVFVWAPDGTRGWSGFWQKDDWEYHFPREKQAICHTLNVLRSIAVYPQPGWFEYAVKVRRHEAL